MGRTNAFRRKITTSSWLINGTDSSSKNTFSVDSNDTLESKVGSSDCGYRIFYENNSRRPSSSSLVEHEHFIKGIGKFFVCNNIVTFNVFFV